MKPVDQACFEDRRGDCLQACVASILELPLAEVPKFIEVPDMYQALRAWLEERGWFLFEFIVNQAEDLSSMFFNQVPSSLCIMGGKGPRLAADGRNKSHAVVASMGGWGVTMVHDPHPSRAGLLDEGYRTLWVFTRGFANEAAQSDERKGRYL